MRKKMYWGIVPLILLLGGFCVFLLIKDRAEIRQHEKELTESNKLLEEHNKEKAKQPPLARDGFKLVPHGDHWHEVPIDAPDVWQGEPHEPNKLVDHPVQAPKTYTGKLTFPAELLKTNPVEALRLQAEERGHWIKDWIPPFPADDHEASELASVVYTIIYNRHTSLDESAEHDILAERAMSLIQGFDTRYPPRSDDVRVRARNWDLTKLTWVLLDSLTTEDQMSELPSEFTQ